MWQNFEQYKDILIKHKVLKSVVIISTWINFLEKEIGICFGLMIRDLNLTGLLPICRRSTDNVQSMESIGHYAFIKSELTNLSLGLGPHSGKEFWN